MTSIDNQDFSRRPTLFGTILVLLVILALYPLAGWLLSSIATGGQPLESVLRDGSEPMLRRILVTQGIGQILVLGFPVFFLASRHSGGSPFGRPTLRWLGVGTGGGVRPALFGAFGMLLLQPFLYSIVELQSLLLPLLGEAGQALVQEQEHLDRFIRLLAGDGSPGSLFASSLVFVLIPSICEELLFRGYIQKSLALNIAPRRAVLFAGLVFALFHLELFNLLPLTLLGWYIGYLYLKSGNLLVPAVAHGVNNLAALVLLHLGGDQMGHAGEMASSSPIFLWPWWVLVVVSLFIFSLLIRYFPQKSASAHAEKSMPGGRL
ncbi:MAG TPA: CPBP family intramembrane metalloprotease [Chlorobaculum parvum]|uniref:CPBP family intramembrane metalloprotease n=1 Tax=Chlorobaculum parvum TaxID=274539 RepID=A0A7C5HSZ4_9CHLB|nr:CPBP family intramembrane metalloprotease [Chlorobaculum parvum]